MALPETTLQLRVNGRERRLPEGATLLTLIESMGLDRRFLVVEHNGEPRSRESFETTILKSGDRLELVRPVAGG